MFLPLNSQVVDSDKLAFYKEIYSRDQDLFWLTDEIKIRLQKIGNRPENGLEWTHLFLFSGQMCQFLPLRVESRSEPVLYFHVFLIVRVLQRYPSLSGKAKIPN